VKIVLKNLEVSMAGTGFRKRRLFFELTGCSYCDRARAELDRAEVPYERIAIKSSDRSLIKLLSGQESVPILVEVIGCDTQDDEIAAYAEEMGR
jgi:glutaredoxin